MRNYPGEYTFKSCEIAVSSCTGGKGFDSNTLFGAPSIDQSSVLPPVINLRERLDRPPSHDGKRPIRFT